jgi:hypothetical protein
MENRTMKTVINTVLKVKDIVMNTLLKHTREMSSWLGGGHTVDTDPTQRGWRMWNLAGVEGARYEFVLVGRKGMNSCFTARTTDEGQIDVYMFEGDMTDHVREVVMDDTIITGWTGECTGNKYSIQYGRINTIDYHPGWALSIIAELEEMDELYNKEVK